MRIASIDVGTNTILLLIAEVHPDGSFSVLRDEQVIARLGKGVDKDRRIAQETFHRAVSYLAAYKATCQKHAVDLITAIGTSALRDAVNRTEFIRFVKENTGIDIEVIPGDTEAVLTYRGAISEFINNAEVFSVIDIGGGSTELITGTGGSILSRTSFDIGSVRLTERFFPSSPPPPHSIAEARKNILSHFGDRPIAIPDTSFVIGVAGTATTLAAIRQELPAYDAGKISGFKLQYDDIGRIFDSLKEKTVDEIKQIPQISAGRADIILAGILILLTAMDFFGIQTITVSDRGLRYGNLLRYLEHRSH
jgi:exopolyphosphatase/guanosine-5'-triphosphate,3'-diphosphate pyrophosphatase